MVDVPDNTTSTQGLEFASDLSVGTYSGRSDFQGDHDWIRVNLTAGTYRFYLSVQNSGPSFGDSILALRDSTGALINSDDNSGADVNSFLEIPLVAGTYYIDCAGNVGPHAASYSVFVTRVAALVAFGSNLDDNLSVASGERLAGGPGDDTIIFTLSGLDALGEQGNDDITGSPLQNTISGGLGDDHANGGAGDDIVFGDAGDDVLQGGQDSDELFGGDGFDVLFGEGGDDIMKGGADDDTLEGGDGNDVMDGGAGIDTAFYVGFVSVSVTLNGAGNATVSVGGVAEDTIRNIENVTGGFVNDTLTGDALANHLRGRDGNDTLNGGGGNDITDGGAGNDTLSGGLGVDNLVGGLGNDTYVLANDADIITDAGGLDTITSTISRTLVNPSIENLALLGTANISGVGNAAVNVIAGNTGMNGLNGGANNDVLHGGVGKDTLIGGLGDDRFYFTSTAHSLVANPDVITDFDDFGNDRIDVSALFGPAMTYRHNLAFTAAGQVRINDIVGADVVVEVNTGGTLAPDLAIRLTATTLASMTATDFVL